MTGPDPLFGEQTRLAISRFSISGEPMPMPVIRALVRLKAAAARTNADLAVAGVSQEMAVAIAAAAEQVLDDLGPDLFPVDVFQTGSGTSTNMNVNEVIATLASRRLGEPVHPNDHVNASQSTNDTMPSAIRMAALDAVSTGLLPALALLERELGLKGRQFHDVVKAGRTHLMDAVPVTLGQEFDGWRAQIADAAARLEQGLGRLGRLPLGGTAAGTGLNAPAEFGRMVIERLATDTGLALTVADDRFALQGGQDDLVELSGHLRTAAVAGHKIANDIRLLASGPQTGLAEIRLPSLQAGSSIMPGKVNPVLCEILAQVAAQVVGNDAAVAFAGSQGQLELNTNLPVLARNVMSSIELLTTATTAFATHCVTGIEADVERCRTLAEATPAAATALNTRLGYDTASDVVKEALATRRSVRQVVLDRGLMAAHDLDEVLDLGAMARPHRDRAPTDLPGEDPAVPPEAIPAGDSGTVGFQTEAD